MEVKVSGMTCGGCVKSVTNAILKVDPNAKIEVSLEKQLISLQTSATTNVISSTIENAGFDVITIS